MLYAFGIVFALLVGQATGGDPVACQNGVWNVSDSSGARFVQSCEVQSPNGPADIGLVAGTPE